MFVQLKTGHNTDKGPAWISVVSFNRTWKTARWHDRTLRRCPGLVDANFYDVETDEEYWISGAASKSLLQRSILRVHHTHHRRRRPGSLRPLDPAQDGTPPGTSTRLKPARAASGAAIVHEPRCGTAFAILSTVVMTIADFTRKRRDICRRPGGDGRRFRGGGLAIRREPIGARCEVEQERPVGAHSDGGDDVAVLGASHGHSAGYGGRLGSWCWASASHQVPDDGRRGRRWTARRRRSRGRQRLRG